MLSKEESIICPTSQLDPKQEIKTHQERRDGRDGGKCPTYKQQHIPLINTYQTQKEDVLQANSNTHLNEMHTNSWGRGETLYVRRFLLLS